MQMGDIYLVESGTSQNLAASFMRFQEYYESPVFRGRVFSVDDLIRWYAGKFGSFSYSKDWYGFNIPGTVLTPFKNRDFNPLTPYERKIIDLCGGVDGDSYIIGVTSADEYFEETVRHEFVHGSFYTNPEYKKEAASCIRDFNIRTVYNGLAKMGYCDDVIIDEINAYVLVEPDTIQEYLSLENSKKLRDQLDRIFEKFFGFSVLKTESLSLISRTKRIFI